MKSESFVYCPFLLVIVSKDSTINGEQEASGFGPCNNKSHNAKTVVAAMGHAHAARERRGGDAPRRDRQPDNAKDQDGRGGAHYLEDVRSSASQMRRPSEGSSLSWRWAAVNLCMLEAGGILDACATVELGGNLVLARYESL